MVYYCVFVGKNESLNPQDEGDLKKKSENAIYNVVFFKRSFKPKSNKHNHGSQCKRKKKCKKKRQGKTVLILTANNFIRRKRSYL